MEIKLVQFGQGSSALGMHSVVFSCQVAHTTHDGGGARDKILLDYASSAQQQRQRKTDDRQR